MPARGRAESENKIFYGKNGRRTNRFRKSQNRQYIIKKRAARYVCPFDSGTL